MWKSKVRTVHTHTNVRTCTMAHRKEEMMDQDQSNCKSRPCSRKRARPRLEGLYEQGCTAT